MKIVHPSGNGARVKFAFIIFSFTIIVALLSAIIWAGTARSAAAPSLSISADISNTGIVTVNYSNSGASDMSAPLLVLQGSDNALLTLDQSKSGQVLNPPAYPPGFSSTIQVIASGTTPGLLKAGESATISVYYCGKLQPADPYSQVDFSLASYETSNTTTINWTSLQGSMRPETIGTDAWGPIWSNFISNMGNTWGQYVARLDQDVIYLGDLGEKVSDVNQLLGFEIEQADGLNLLKSLEYVTDVDIAQPGLSIDFSRSFPVNISQRYVLGPLGRGWSHSWQYSLIKKSDGSVLIEGPGGSIRSFFPNGSGGYTPQLGDHGTLSDTGGGTFTLTETSGLLAAFYADGTLNYVQDTNGNRITAGYSNGLLTSLTHSSGESLSISYNASSRIASINDPAKGVTTFSYDASNEHLMSVTDYSGKTTSYSYISGQGAAQEHALSQIDYPGGIQSNFSYDDGGREKQNSELGNAEPVVFSYGPSGEVDVTNASGATSKFFMDYRGLIFKTVDPLGNEINSSYDTDYNLTSLTDPAGKSYNYLYNAQGNMTKSTDPTGHSTEFSYGALGRITSLTDANGNHTSYNYDVKGNDLSVSYTNGTSESWAYDSKGSPTAKTNGRGHVINYSYDANGRITKKNFADSTTASFNYDVRGNLASTVDPTGTTDFTYDGADQLTRIDYPGGQNLDFTYDDAGRRTSSLDQTGHRIDYHYDAVGRLESLTDENNNEIVHYGYDSTGRLVKKTVGNGGYTTYEYDAASELIHLINYKQGGSVQSRFDYAYDNRGRRTSMDTIDGNWTYGYDDLGQLTHAVLVSTNSDIPSQDLTYNYDAMGNRISTVENGTTTNYTTNNMNQYTQTQVVNAGSLPLSLQLTRAYWSSFADYQSRQLSVDVTINNDGTSLAAGMQITKSVNTNGVTNSSKLPAVAGDIPANGNRTITLKYEVPAGVGSFRTSFMGSAKDVAGASHIYPGDTIDVTTTNIYDADGNLIQEASLSGNTNYAYSDENRLTGISSPQDNAQFTYDANGNRVRSKENGTITNYVIDPAGLGNIVGEYDESGQMKDHYDYGLGLIRMLHASGDPYYYNYDANGNTSETTDKNNLFINQYCYDPYGKELYNAPSQITNRFKYVGEAGVNSDFQVVEMRARIYDKISGRFLSQDPLGQFESLNLYSYVLNNPMMLIDPSGLRPKNLIELEEQWKNEGMMQALFGAGYGVYKLDKSAIEFGDSLRDGKSGEISNKAWRLGLDSASLFGTAVIAPVATAAGYISDYIDNSIVNGISSVFDWIGHTFFGWLFGNRDPVPQGPSQLINYSGVCPEYECTIGVPPHL